MKKHLKLFKGTPEHFSPPTQARIIAKELKRKEQERVVVLRKMRQKKSKSISINEISVDKTNNKNVQITVHKTSKVNANVEKICKKNKNILTSRREGFLLKRRATLVQELYLKRIELKMFYGCPRSVFIKDQIQDLKIRINVIRKKQFKQNWGTWTVKGAEKPRVIYGAIINKFFSIDRKSRKLTRNEEDRPILRIGGCPSCGTSRKGHNGMRCGFIQISQNCSKEVLQKCPKCGKSERLPHRQFCDICTEFVKCLICNKKTCRRGQSFCQNCYIMRKLEKTPTRSIADSFVMYQRNS